MQELTRGANCPCPAPVVFVSVACASAVDVSALLVADTGKVRSDEDFVFYNNPTGLGVTYVGASTAPRGVDAVRVDTTAVDVDKVVVTASLDGSGPETFAGAGSMVVSVLDEALVELVRYDITGLATEKALLCVEVYQRGGAWKVRAVGQGYESGLAGIATDFGITVDDEPAPPPPPPAIPPPPAAAAPPPPPFAPPPPLASERVDIPAPATPKINLDKGKVSLQKNQSVSLVKTGGAPLAAFAMGLGWDPAKRGKSVDLDASVIAFDASGKDLDMVWFMHKQAFGGAIRHSGDNVTGQGDGDDETINVDVSRLPAEVRSLVFTVTSYGGQKFTAVSRAYCRLIDLKTNTELVRFDLTETNSSTGVVMCKLVKEPDGTWTMTSIGSFADGKTVKKLLEPARSTLS